MLVDTHTHLFVKEFEEDREQVIQRHGRSLQRGGLSLEQLDHVGRAQNLLRNRVYIGIGETGLDYYWDLSYKKEQIKSLERHITWAIEFRLPIVLHTRESFDDTYELIRSANCDELRGIFHCFSGTEEDAMKVISLGGFKLGIGGVFTFKNSTLRESLKNISLDHIVLETDSPYLAPHPFRGKRNESAYLRVIAERMAEERNLSVKEIEEVTSRNALSLFPQIQQ